MATKKIPTSAQPSDPALVERVDAMMDPLAKTPALPVAPTVARSSPTIDIFNDLKTAPKLPGDLIKAANNIREPIVTQPLAPPPSPVIPKLPTSSGVVLPNLQPRTIPVPVVLHPVVNDDTDDPDTDKAIDEIMAAESDIVLAAQDASVTDSPSPRKKPARGNVFKRIITNKWFWMTLALLIITLFAVPLSRYKLLGLVIKRPVGVVITDSVAHTPVSGATVSFRGSSTQTDANGRAILHVPLGPDEVTVTKQYYKTQTYKINVDFGAPKPYAYTLIATGRQVPINVTNKITGKPISNALIKILGTTAKTDQQGHASLVLPAQSVSNSATVTADGYNDAKTDIQITASVVPTYTIPLTPAGRVYFLASHAGKVDVVRTNLDGTDRQVVLASTGKEDPATTSLLAARDWRYVVLKSHRDGTQPALYMIDTATDKVTEFDNSDADFTLVGWSGHTFVYDLARHGTQVWQTGHESLKSYNAENAQLNQLDQNLAEGTASSYATQSFSNFVALNAAVVYTTKWLTHDASGAAYDLGTKVDTVRTVQTDASGKKDYQSFAASDVTTIQAALYQPQAIKYAVHTLSDNKTTYYLYIHQAVTAASDVSDADLSKAYPVYVTSPSGARTFWTDKLGTKDVLYMGGADAQTPKQLSTASGYVPYGWYGDDYVLVSQSGGELYIMPAAGLNSGQQPLKVTNFYGPPAAARISNFGYGIL